MTRWLPWLVAVLAGGGAALLASRYMSTRISTAEAALAQAYELRPVIVAARAIPAGQTVQVEDLALRKVPVRFTPSEARGADASGEIVGRATLHALAPGDPVLPSALQSNDLPSLASLVGEDRRAITLAVDEINGFAGLLSPGDSVDLVFVADEEAAHPGAAVARPLLEGVTVIATGRSTRRVRATDGNGVARDVDVDYATVALDVAPVDAQRLVLAQRTGEVTVLLRSADRAGAQALRVIDTSALTGPLRLPRVSRVQAVQLIIGGTAAQPMQRLEAPAT
ncbi:MAG: Flp pilus assembly protein CpaB [Steroidobacteraceae bacterium]